MDEPYEIMGVVPYPAKRVTEFYHIIDGVECFVIHEYRADGLVLTQRTSMCCELVEMIGEDTVWASVEMDFRANLEKAPIG